MKGWLYRLAFKKKKINIIVIASSFVRQVLLKSKFPGDFLLLKY